MKMYNSDDIKIVGQNLTDCHKDVDSINNQIKNKINRIRTWNQE